MVDAPAVAHRGSAVDAGDGAWGLGAHAAHSERAVTGMIIVDHFLRPLISVRMRYE